MCCQVLHLTQGILSFTYNPQSISPEALLGVEVKYTTLVTTQLQNIAAPWILGTVYIVWQGRTLQPGPYVSSAVNTADWDGPINPHTTLNLNLFKKDHSLPLKRCK